MMIFASTIFSPAASCLLPRALLILPFLIIFSLPRRYARRCEHAESAECCSAVFFLPSLIYCHIDASAATPCLHAAFVFPGAAAPSCRYDALARLHDFRFRAAAIDILQMFARQHTAYAASRRAQKMIICRCCRATLLGVSERLCDASACVTALCGSSKCDSR